MNGRGRGANCFLLSLRDAEMDRLGLGQRRLNLQ